MQVHPFARRLARLLPIAVLGLGLLAGCREKSAAPAEIEARRGSFSKAEVDQTRLPARALDAESLANMARLLAGEMPEADEGKLDPVWRQHAEAMDKAWAKIGPRMDAMRVWSTEKLDADAPAAPLFYPFGGPDLFSVLALYPRAPVYVLVGLEAPGRLPLPEELGGATLADDLARLRMPFDSMVESGYFVRTQIDSQLSGGHFDGLLPIVLIALARAGQEPFSVQYVELDKKTGQVVKLADTVESAGAFRVQFRPVGQPEAPPRSVFYFAQDLSNDGVYPASPFHSMVERLAPFDVYIKSGEYLCHTDAFSNLRRLILDRSDLILQDDSGIPLRFFTSDRWQVAYYGHYSDVLAAYKNWFQDDLAAAFANGKGVEPLPFSAGYHTNTSGGCLILSTRKSGEKRQVQEIGP